MLYKLKDLGDRGLWCMGVERTEGPSPQVHLGSAGMTLRKSALICAFIDKGAGYLSAQ